MARCKYVAWQIGTKLLLGVIYIALVSDGLRCLVPALGQRLYKLPLLGELKNYESTYRLDLAPFMAVFILVAVFWLWDKLLEAWLRTDAEFECKGFKHEEYRKLVFRLGIVILSCDAILFFAASASMDWGIPVAAVFATVAYVSILVFVSFVTINLRQALKG